MSPRRLLDTSWVSGESREVQTCSFFFGYFSQSPASLGDVSVSCGAVAETNFVRDWGDVSTMSPRPAETKETEETLRRRLRDAAWPTLETAGDVAATEKTSQRRPRYFQANWLSPCLETSPRRRLGESASHFFCLPSRRDVSAIEIGP